MVGTLSFHRFRFHNWAVFGRFLTTTVALHNMLGLKAGDVVYNPLPMFHASGGVLGLGECLVSGLTIVVRRRFSASQYWLDCVRWRCTVRG
jgi:solute carrier family 27 fatty acid transporter 1/4